MDIPNPKISTSIDTANFGSGVTSSIRGKSDNYSLIEGDCPYCGAYNTVYRNNTLVLTSNPPQFQYHCKQCNKLWSAYSDGEAIRKETSQSTMDSKSISINGYGNLVGDGLPNNYINWNGIYPPNIPCDPVPGQNYNYQEGWICPKCGRVNAPWVPSCPCSNGKPNQATTNVVGIKDFSEYTDAIKNAKKLDELTPEEREELLKKITVSTDNK